MQEHLTLGGYLTFGALAMAPVLGPAYAIPIFVVGNYISPFFGLSYWA
jgi:hypothetical protein